MSLEDFVDRPIKLVEAELCTYRSDGNYGCTDLTRQIRERRKLPVTAPVSQSYLRLRDQSGTWGWFGPLEDRFGVTTTRLTELVRSLAFPTSIFGAVRLMEA